MRRIEREQPSFNLPLSPFFSFAARQLQSARRLQLLKVVRPFKFSLWGFNFFLVVKPKPRAPDLLQCSLSGHLYFETSTQLGIMYIYIFLHRLCTSLRYMHTNKDLNIFKLYFSR